MGVGLAAVRRAVIYSLVRVGQLSAISEAGRGLRVSRWTRTNARERAWVRKYERSARAR